MSFNGNPVAKIHCKSKARQVSYFTSEVTSIESSNEIVDNLMQEWSQIVHLFQLVDDLEDYLRY
jgi:hypothetical protein